MRQHDHQFWIARLPKNPESVAIRTGRKCAQAAFRLLCFMGRRARAFFRHARIGAFFLPADRPRSGFLAAAMVPRYVATMQLAPRSPVVLANPDHQTIACDAGIVWVTQGDGSDYVLTAGQSLALRPQDDVILMAMNAPAIIRRTG